MNEANRSLKLTTRWAALLEKGEKARGPAERRFALCAYVNWRYDLK